MIDRYQLRYFLAVVEAGNFSRAAERVNVTQPTLSTGIAKLEAEVGARLFLRNSRRVSLTAEGNRFLTHARTIEAGFNAIESHRPEAGPRRPFRLGLLRSIPTRFLEVLVARRQSPALLEVIEGSEGELLTRLASGRVDAAVSLSHDSPHLTAEPLFREGYALALPLSHPLAQRAEIDGAELANEVMMVRRSCEALAETSRYFTTRGVRPHFSFRSLSDDRVLALVAAGLGITVLPESHRHPGVAQVRLTGFDRMREVGLLSPRAAPPDPALTADIRATAQEFREGAI